MSGWVKIHRKINDNPLLGSNPKARFVFMELLIAAAWTDCAQDWRGKPVNVARGQAMISERALAKQTGISYQSVRTILQNLASHDLIKINALPNNGPRVVTICNYCKYQDEQRTPNAPTNAPLTHSQRTKEEGKKGRREEELSLAPSAAPEGTKARNEYPDWFERFWTAYPGPRKQLKAKCLDIAKTAIKAKTATEDQFHQAVIEKRGINKDPSYQMAPERWLRNKAWLDPIPWREPFSSKTIQDEFRGIL